ELWHRKSQLISGILAITLGIAIIVGIRSVSEFSEKAVAVQLDNLGANILVLPQASSIDNYYSADIDAPTMPQDYVDKIVNSTIPGVDNLSPKLTRRVDIGKNKVVLTGILPKSEIASKPIWQQSGLLGGEIKASCDPTSAANKSNGLEDKKLQRRVIDTLAGYDCFVGSLVAQKLKVKDGDSIPIHDRSFTVVRVLQETGTVDDDRIFANIASVQAVLGIPNQVSAIEVMGCCNAISDGLLGKLRNILPDTRITTISQIVSTQIGTNQMMKKISLVFLIIILFVGGISIGNYIWANVNERRKEIGILRMMGYSRRNIHLLLISKAIFLGLVGGIVGYVIGTLAGVFLGPYLAGIDVHPVPILFVWSILIAVTISIIGSIIPAWLAGKIEPFSTMQEV
ncbi:MAG: ABC transporter permease, partial [Bacteroidetes bacterium]|nr:ABC transporter permease [Bacteroidota bacterium]